MAKLTALSVKNAKPGRHGDGDGLYLLVKPSGAKSWLLRVQVDGRRRDIGLGSLAARSLAEAREKAAELRKHALNGRDPIAERDRDRRPTPTFKAAAIETHKELGQGWAKKTADAFLASLGEHGYPSLGAMRVDHIETQHIQDALRPIWTAKPAMARKVRQHIATVLNYSKSRGWRAHEAPGREVSRGLPKRPKAGHFKAMPYADVPAFVADARSKAPTVGRNALLFLIFTAARPGEVRRARWGQIDLAKRDWNRPAEIMKGDEKHTVTLNDAAIALLEQIKTGRSPGPDDLIFPGGRGAMLSDMALNKVLRDARQPYDAHGFRSSFRDWAAERMPAIPDAVAEAALAHLVPDEVVRAYKRTKFIEMRRRLLAAWSSYLGGQPNRLKLVSSA